MEATTCDAIIENREYENQQSCQRGGSQLLVDLAKKDEARSGIRKPAVQTAKIIIQFEAIVTVNHPMWLSSWAMWTQRVLRPFRNKVADTCGA